jgi:hypothetical protein
MASKSQKLALLLLREAEANGTLDKSIKAELAEFISVEARPKLQEVIRSFFARRFTKEVIKSFIMRARRFAKEVFKPFITREPSNIAKLTKKLNLETQYGERLDTLKHYDFLNENGEANEGNAACPSFEKAMSTFKLKELKIASHFQKPTLLLIPETSFDAKIKALDTHKQGMQENETRINKVYSETDSGSDKITGWRAVIVDGAQEMEAYKGDSLDLRFDKRIKNRKAARKPGEKGMDRHKCALLMMEIFKDSDPIDKKFYTLLDDDPVLLLDDDPALSDFGTVVSGVPSASFNSHDHNVHFNWYGPNDVYNGARFRSSVGGDDVLMN